MFDVQALAASLNKIIARHLKAENASVSLLYISVVGTLGSLLACSVVPNSWALPNSAPVSAFLLANGEAFCAWRRAYLNIEDLLLP